MVLCSKSVLRVSITVSLNFESANLQFFSLIKKNYSSGLRKLPIPSEVGSSNPIRNWKLAEQFPASG
jgi:hypothetical protein